MQTVESDSSVWCTPWIQTSRYDALCDMMHSAKLDSAVRCTPLSFLRTVHHLTLGWDAHRGAWLRSVMHTLESDSAVYTHTAESDSTVGCTMRSFFKIWISRRNRNRIWKYFSLFIRAQMGLNHEKTGGQKSRDTLPFRSNTLSRTRFQYETPKNNFQIWELSKTFFC